MKNYGQITSRCHIIPYCDQKPPTCLKEAGGLSCKAYPPRGHLQSILCRIHIRVDSQYGADGNYDKSLPKSIYLTARISYCRDVLRFLLFLGVDEGS